MAVVPAGAKNVHVAGAAGSNAHHDICTASPLPLKVQLRAGCSGARVVTVAAERERRAGAVPTVLAGMVAMVR